MWRKWRMKTYRLDNWTFAEDTDDIISHCCRWYLCRLRYLSVQELEEVCCWVVCGNFVRILWEKRFGGRLYLELAYEEGALVNHGTHQIVVSLTTWSERKYVFPPAGSQVNSSHNGDWVLANINTSFIFGEASPAYTIVTGHRASQRKNLFCRQRKLLVNPSPVSCACLSWENAPAFGTNFWEQLMPLSFPPRCLDMEKSSLLHELLHLLVEALCIGLFMMSLFSGKIQTSLFHQTSVLISTSFSASLQPICRCLHYSSLHLRSGLWSSTT